MEKGKIAPDLYSSSSQFFCHAVASPASFRQCWLLWLLYSDTLRVCVSNSGTEQNHITKQSKTQLGRRTTTPPTHPSSLGFPSLPISTSTFWNSGSGALKN
ncbi:hypothetical protein P8452_67145 [Trifolium repens]|nr:hypothetical protein P8452_67145 [Trifolium repens]